jgi:hypothetical protein
MVAKMEPTMVAYWVYQKAVYWVFLRAVLRVRCWADSKDFERAALMALQKVGYWVDWTVELKVVNLAG